MIIIPEKWINEPDENGNGLLQADIKGGDMELPVPVETHNVAAEDVTLGSEQDFCLVIEGAYDITLFSDEEDYNSRRDSSFASEAFVPAGLFSPEEDEDFVPNSTAIINGRVTSTYDDPVRYGFESSDVIFSLACLGYEFDAVIHEGTADFKKVEIGNIVSGIYWIQGWPQDD